jgi:hypothetical protein
MTQTEVPTGQAARVFAGFAQQILCWRWFVLLIIAGLTVFFVSQLRYLRMDNANENFVTEGDPTTKLMDKFRLLFGNDDFVYLLIETDGFFHPDTIRRIKALAEDLEAHVPHLKDMKFLGNVEYVQGVAGGIETLDLIDGVPTTAPALDQARARAMNEPLYLDNLISRDGKTAAILLEFARYPHDHTDPRKDSPPVIYKILAKPEHAGLKIYAVGGPIIDYEFDAIAGREAPRLGMFALLLALVILVWTIRSVHGVIGPLLVVILTVFWTLGMVGLLGWPLTLFVILLPILIVCASIGNAMHVIAEFQDQHAAGLTRHEAIVRALAVVGMPCALTTLTTAVGFLSFLGTQIKPIREMGVYMALGVTAAAVLSLTLVPIVLSFGKSMLPSTDDGPGRFTRLLTSIARLNQRSPRTVLTLFLVLTAISLLGYLRVEVETNSVQDLSTQVPIRQASDYVDAHMGGAMSVELMLDTHRPDGVKDIAFLLSLEQLQQFLDQHPLTRKTSSVLDLLKKMRRAMHEDRPDAYALPDTTAQASEYLFLYETSGGKELDKLVSLQYDVARLTVRTRSLNTKDIRAFMADIERFVAHHLDPSISVEPVGTIAWMKTMSDHVSTGQGRSFLLALGAITLMLCWILGSVKLGVIGMLPNVFPVLLAFGVMGYAGLFMSMSMVIMAPVILAVSDDDTVHFLVHYRRAFDRCGNYQQALTQTLTGVGRPLLFTTLALVAGFLMFCFSVNRSVQQFGGLGAFTFLWALLADFFLVPAVLLLFKPLGPEQDVAPDFVAAQVSEA